MTDSQITEHGCNAVNRGVYISDNLPFLRSLNDACVDLVCIDPPFALKRSLNLPVGRMCCGAVCR